MAYSITIGEFKGESDGFPQAETVEHENAPADGVPTDRTNQRWPSYSGWADFVDDTGLSGLFAELMPGHPGFCKIERRHLDAINAVDTTALPKHHAVRMVWLKYWMDWALVNCKNPVIINT